MTKEEILNGMSEEEFYNLYPTEEAYFMAKGGSLSGAPHNGQPTADEFFSYGAPALGHMNIPMSNPTYLAHGGTYFGGPTRPYAYGGLYKALEGVSTSPYGTDLYTEKKMSTQDWDKFNMEKGYTKIPGKSAYATYYNPKEYKPDSWGENNSGLTFTRIGDEGKTVNYSEDPNYKPIVQYGYKDPEKPIKPNKVIPTLSNRTQVDTNEYFKTLKGADNKLSYYDIKTNQPIDPTKSFQGGKYNPSLLNPPVATNETPRASIEAVTMAYGGGLPGGPHEMPCMNCGGYMQDGGYNSPTNYGSFSVPMAYGGFEEYGGILDASNNQDYPMMQEGGRANLMKLIKSAKKSMKKKFDTGGDTTIQGGNQDYIAKKRSMYDNFIKQNVYNSLIDQEEKDITQAFMQDGGFQQPMLNQSNALYQQSLNNNMNQWQEQNAANNQNFFNSSLNLAGNLDNIALQGRAAQAAMEAAAQSSMPKAANGIVWKGKKYNTQAELDAAQKAAFDKESKALEEGTANNSDSETKSNTPNATWYQALATMLRPDMTQGLSHLPANINRGYGLSNKDYSKLYNLTQGSTPSRIGMKYGPLAKALGKIGRRMFGPKEIYMDVNTPYEERMRVKSSPDLASLGPKDSKFKGPYPETESSPFTEGFPAMHTAPNKPVDNIIYFPTNTPSKGAPTAIPSAADPFTGNISKEIYAQSQLQRYGGIPKAQVGFSNPVDMTMSAISNLKAKQPDYLPQQSATDMFAKQTDADLKNTLDNTKLVNPETGTSYEKDRIRFKRKGVGKALAQYTPALANTIASGLEYKDYQNAQKDLANSQTADRMFLASTGNSGDTDQWGNFRPNNNVAVQFPGGLYNSAYGGPLPKALSGLEIKMQPGLYGTNGNRQFTLPTQVNSQKFAQQPTEVRSSLTKVKRKDANLEAEGGETALVNIDGIPAHFKISGNRHSKGGVPLNLPDNSFIFSDTAKMKIKDPNIQAEFGMSFKKGGYTPAEIAKKFDINKYRQVLADPNSEDIDRKTAEMMISNLNLKLAKLGLAQESMKGFPQGIPVMAMPYIMSNEIDPSVYLPTQSQEEQKFFF